MISWRIWRALMTPFVAHPLYQRWGVWQPVPLELVRKQRFSGLMRWLGKNELHLLMGFAFLAAVAMLWFGFWNVFFVVIVSLIALVFVLGPLLLIASGTIYGILSGLVVSSTIINEKLQGRYLLLGLTNYGFEGANLALCTLAIHNNDLLRELRMTLRRIFGFIVAPVVIPALNILFIYSIDPNPDLLRALRDVILLLFILLGIPFDFMQSSTIAKIIGMLAPTFSRTRTNVQQLVLSAFLSIQIGTYVFWLTIVLFSLPSFLGSIGVSIDVWYILVAYLVLYAIREFIIIVLWHLLASQLRADLDDLDRLTHVGIRRTPLTVILSSLLHRLPGDRPEVA